MGVFMRVGDDERIALLMRQNIWHPGIHRCASKSRAEFGDMCTVCNRPAEHFRICPM